jgi:hypothetical protein
MQKDAGKSAVSLVAIYAASAEGKSAANAAVALATEPGASAAADETQELSKKEKKEKKKREKQDKKDKKNGKRKAEEPAADEPAVKKPAADIDLGLDGDGEWEGEGDETTGKPKRTQNEPFRRVKSEEIDVHDDAWAVIGKHSCVTLYSFVAPVSRLFVHMPSVLSPPAAYCHDATVQAPPARNSLRRRQKLTIIEVGTGLYGLVRARHPGTRTRSGRGDGGQGPTTSW